MSTKRSYIFAGLATVLLLGLVSGLFWYFQTGQEEGAAEEDTPRSGVFDERDGAQRGIPIPKAGEVKNIAWEDVAPVLRTGNIVAVSQQQNLEVRMAVRNAGIYVTTEPEIDAIIKAVQACGLPCSGVVISTE